MNIILCFVLLFFNFTIASNNITLDDVNNSLDHQGESIVSINEQTKLWTSFNEPDRSDGNVTGLDNTIVIKGNTCTSRGCWTYAQCPNNTRLVSGGWELTHYNGGTGFSAPNASFPDVDKNRWALYRGGMDEFRGYRPYALCARK